MPRVGEKLAPFIASPWCVVSGSRQTNSLVVESRQGMVFAAIWRLRAFVRGRKKYFQLRREESCGR